MRSSAGETSKKDASDTVHPLLAECQQLATFMDHRNRRISAKSDVHAALAAWQEEVLQLQDRAAQTPRAELGADASRVDRMIADMLQYHQRATGRRVDSALRVS